MERNLLRAGAWVCAVFQVYKYTFSVPTMLQSSDGRMALVASRLLPLAIVLVFLGYSLMHIRGRLWRGAITFLGVSEIGLFLLYFLPSAGYLNLRLAMRAGGFVSSAFGAGLLLLDSMRGRPAPEVRGSHGAKPMVGGLVVGLVLLAIVATFLIWGR